MIVAQARLVVAGVNFHRTALEIRNKFAFTTEHIKNVYSELNDDNPEEFFILSTCNRTEIYSTTERPETLLNLLASHNQLSEEQIEQYSFIKTGDEAVTHLFKVASGLDSQILGDYEIIGQLKNAFNLAKSYNRTNGYMEKLVNFSLHASRDIKSRTRLSDGTTSVSYAAIQLLKQFSADNKAQRVCLLGLGKIGTLTLKNLKNYLPQHTITVVNRNENKARNAAEEHSVSYAPFASQQEVLSNTDVLIVATGADHPVVTKADIEASNVKLVFDLSVPSNVSADVKGIAGVQFFNIDELSQIVNQTLQQRQSEIPVAEEIIETHFEEFRQWENRRSEYKAKGKTTLADTIKNKLSDNFDSATNNTNSDTNKPAGTLAG